jgi:hypothetical protein
MRKSEGFLARPCGVSHGPGASCAADPELSRRRGHDSCLGDEFLGAGPPRITADFVMTDTPLSEVFESEAILF